MIDLNLLAKMDCRRRG